MLCVLAGCGREQPSALYENTELGFSFRAPAGWSERARCDDIPSRITHERLLVQYKRLQAGNPAWLRLSLVDLPETASLEAYLRRRSPGREWQRKSDIEALDFAGDRALLATFVGKCGPKDLLCEAIARRRGNRVYLFTGLFGATDGQSREAFREAVAQARLEKP
jgi:hypothetical protein